MLNELSGIPGEGVVLDDLGLRLGFVLVARRHAILVTADNGDRDAVVHFLADAPLVPKIQRRARGFFSGIPAMPLLILCGE